MGLPLSSFRVYASSSHLILSQCDFDQGDCRAYDVDAVRGLLLQGGKRGKRGRGMHMQGNRSLIIYIYVKAVRCRCVISRSSSIILWCDTKVVGGTDIPESGLHKPRGMHRSIWVSAKLWWRNVSTPLGIWRRWPIARVKGGRAKASCPTLRRTARWEKTGRNREDRSSISYAFETW